MVTQARYFGAKLMNVQITRMLIFGKWSGYEVSNFGRTNICGGFHILRNHNGILSRQSTKVNQSNNLYSLGGLGPLGGAVRGQKFSFHQLTLKITKIITPNCLYFYCKFQIFWRKKWTNRMLFIFQASVTCDCNSIVQY